MYINEIRLANIRSYQTSDTQVALKLGGSSTSAAGLTVLAGKNGSGKSTILRAIALALAGPAVARSLMPSFSGWITEGEEAASVQVAYSQGDDDALNGGGAPTVKQTWAGLKWTRSETGEQPGLDKHLPARAPAGAPARGPWADNPRGWFVAGYGPFRRLSSAGTDAQRLMLGNPRTAALATLFDETATLAEATWWLQDIYPRVLEKDPKFVALQRDVFLFLNNGLLPDDTRIVKYDSTGLWIAQNGRTLLLEELSDGFRVAAALVLDIVRRMFQAFGRFDIEADEDGRLRCLHAGVVLIDELDVHLHVSWQQRIGFWLRDHFPRVQFIVSTHSPFICQAASPGSLVRLASPGETDRTPRVLSDAEERRVINGGADDAVLSDLFGLDSPLAPPAQARRERLTYLEASGQGDTPEARSLSSEMELSPPGEVAHVLSILMQKLERHA